MPIHWLFSIILILLAVFVGLLVWQRKRVVLAHEFLSEVKSELKKVTWPGRREVLNTTMVVIVAVFFFGIYLSLIDYVVGTSRLALYDAIGIGSTRAE